VGDEDFQTRSKARTEAMMNSGCAVVLVTHDLTAVKSMATRAIYLDHGAMKASGKPADVIDAYHADLK
jgi:ABC-type polysaccharide/polyol phosphate transport system ATPase subunit